MKRDEIRDAVDVALAERGFARGLYRWRGAWLEAWVNAEPFDNPAVCMRLPSGISRKRFREAIEAIEAIGPARAVRIREREPRLRQMDIEEIIAA